MRNLKLFRLCQGCWKRTACQRGFSIVEMLVVGLILAFLVGATMEFYLNQHNQWLTQTQIADLQQNARNTMDALTGAIRSAGYGVFGAPAFTISPTQDTLAVFVNNSGAINTVRFFVNRSLSGNPRLLRRIDNQEPQVFAEHIDTVRFVPTGSTGVTVTLVARERMLKGSQYDNYTRRLVSTIRLKNR